MKSIFEQTGGSYTRQGDYILPDLKLPEARDREIGVWGQRYGRWLKAQHRVLYYNLLTKGRLNEALADAKNDFASAWTIAEKPVTNYGTEKIFTAKYSGGLGMSDFKAWWKSFSAEEIQSQAEALAAEAQSMNPGYTVTMYFSYDSWNLGTAFAFGDYERSNFTAAGVWIK